MSLILRYWTSFSHIWSPAQQEKFAPVTFLLGQREIPTHRSTIKLQSITLMSSFAISILFTPMEPNMVQI